MTAAATQDEAAGESTPFLFAEGLTVCIDFGNPHAYLAVEPTLALAKRLGVKVDWLPFLVPPLTAPKPELPDDDRGARHRRIRARYFEGDLARYALAYGIDLGDIYRPRPSRSAHLALLWIRRAAPERTGAFVATQFEQIWRAGVVADADGVRDVTSLLEALAVSSDDFAAWASSSGDAELDTLQNQLGVAGVFGVPAYVLGGEVFLGRQHLPMIEWQLGGKRGDPPV